MSPDGLAQWRDYANSLKSMTINLIYVKGILCKFLIPSLFLHTWPGVLAVLGFNLRSRYFSPVGQTWGQANIIRLGWCGSLPVFLNFI